MAVKVFVTAHAQFLPSSISYEVFSIQYSYAEKIDATVDDKEIPDIILEKYYAIFYFEQWYVGRILENIDNLYKIKFLKKELENLLWPKEEDIAYVNINYIFYGPIELIGSGPFELKRVDKINIDKKYKILKKECREETRKIKKTKYNVQD